MGIPIDFNFNSPLCLALVPYKIIGYTGFPWVRASPEIHHNTGSRAWKIFGFKNLRRASGKG
jgi:hypothetical protein